MLSALTLIVKSPETQKKKQIKKDLLEKERTLHNEKAIAIFNAFSSLPVCITLKKISGHGDRYSTTAIVNGINNMTVILTTLNFGKHYLELRMTPNRISAQSNTDCNATLELDEAEKLLALWTLMSKPYHILDWPLECQANEKSPNPETHDNVHE